MDPRYILPKESKNILDRSAYGYTEDLLDRVCLELKSSPAIVEYLQKRAIDISTLLIMETDHTTPEPVRQNLNAVYSGKLSELKELFYLSQAQLNPERKEK